MRPNPLDGLKQAGIPTTAAEWQVKSNQLTDDEMARLRAQEFGNPWQTMHMMQAGQAGMSPWAPFLTSLSQQSDKVAGGTSLPTSPLTSPSTIFNPAQTSAVPFDPRQALTGLKTQKKVR